MKDELDGKMIKELVGLSAKTYLIDDGSGDKKRKCKKSVL